MLLKEMLCAQCEGGGLALQDDGRVVCRFCGAVAALNGVVCPECEFVSPPGSEACEHCRRPLLRPCPRCQAKNWVGHHQCQRCGQPIDALAQVADRWLQSQAGADLEAIRAVQAEEAASSQRRQAQLLEAEKRRQAELQAAAARQAARDRQLMQTLLIGLGAIAVLAVGATLVILLLR